MPMFVAEVSLLTSNLVSISGDTPLLISTRISFSDGWRRKLFVFGTVMCSGYSCAVERSRGFTFVLYLCVLSHWGNSMCRSSWIFVTRLRCWLCGLLCMVHRVLRAAATHVRCV